MIDYLLLIFLGVVSPILVVLLSGLTKQIAFRKGVFHCHDYHLGVEFIFAHIAVCIAVFFDTYRRFKAAQPAALQAGNAQELLDEFIIAIAILCVFAITGFAIMLIILVCYQQLRLPAKNAYDEIMTLPNGRTLLKGNMLNHHGLSHDFMVGVIWLNLFAILPFGLLLVWVLHHG